MNHSFISYERIVKDLSDRREDSGEGAEGQTYRCEDRQEDEDFKSLQLPHSEPNYARLLQAETSMFLGDGYALYYVRRKRSRRNVSFYSPSLGHSKRLEPEQKGKEKLDEDD